MKENTTRRPKKRTKLSKRNKRALRQRRIIAALLAALAIALGALIWRTGLSAAALMWGAAAALMLLHACVLCTRYRMPRSLHVMFALACTLLVLTGFAGQYLVRVDGGFALKHKVVTHIQVRDRYPDLFDRMERLTYLDMRGSTVEDFEPIRSMTTLEAVDLRENYAFTPQEHDALAAALPNCDIRWSVPVGNTYFDSEEMSVDVSDQPLTNAQLRELFAAYPDKHFDYRVPLFGKRYAPDVEALDLRGEALNIGAIDDALTLLPAVSRVDLRGTPATADVVSAMSDAHPDIDFSFTFDVPGAELTTEDVSVTVNGTYDDLLGYLPFLEYMPNLQQVDARGVILTEEQVDALAAHPANDKMLYTFTVFGVKVTSLDTELNLDNIPVGSVYAVEKVLAKMPYLTRVSMCDCGLTEDQMGQLFDAHPDIKFVWWLEFGKYRLRTDATAFTTALGDGNRFGYNSNTFRCLRYCTDLMMLDLGHNSITDLSAFRKLTKLRVLILADNKITDISDLQDMNDLEFVELFLNDISDFSPLADKPNLVDLNVFYNPIHDENIGPFLSMPKLKRLWIGHCYLSNGALSQIRRAHPQCKVNIKGSGSTGAGWRRHPHYYTLKEMYETGEYIPFD